MGKKMALWPVILLLMFAALYGFGIIIGYWTLMIAVIFIAVGFVVGFLLQGSGSQDTKMGFSLLVSGIILLLIVWFFPK